MGYTTSPGAIIRIGVDGANTSRREIDTVAASMNRLSDTVQSAMRNLASTIGVGGGLVQIVQLSDEYTKFTSQLRLATQSQREYTIAYGDVKRIAKDAQSDLAGTGVLYARIANGTRELGVNQARVAAITEVVNLSLKVSAATTAEAASAQLQLSQAFASGTLRGEEFNAVNEAAPRLMKALADGMGVPIGALKEMAKDGKITSQMMADVLPAALETLREEAKQVQTIGGAFTVLKNNVMEFTGATAQSNGTVSVLTGAIGLLANNLSVVMGALTTLTAIKLGTWFAGAATKAFENVVANRALASSTIAAAEAEVAATAAASTLAAARVVELRAAVLAADGAVALAIATNGLIPAQARAAALAEAHTLALAGQTAALRAASVAGGMLRGVLAFLGGPIGAVIAVLGIAATAWTLMGNSAKEGADKAAGAARESTDEILAGLDRQIDKLHERNKLARLGIPTTKTDNPASVRLGEVVASIGRAGKAEGEYAGLDLATRTELLKVLGGEYGRLTEKIAVFNKESAEDSAIKNAKTATEWMVKYANNTEKLNAELDKARKDLGAGFTPELEARIRKQFEVKDAGAKRELSAYASLVLAVNEKIEATRAEANGLKPLNEAQKLQIALDEKIATGKLKIAPQNKAAYELQIKQLGVNLEVIASNKRAAQGAADMKKVWDDYAESTIRAVEAGVKEAEKNEELARTFGMTKAAIEQLELARLQDQLAQRSSVGMTLDEIAMLEKLIAAKQRSSIALAAVDGLEKQKATWEAVDKTAHDFFINIWGAGKSTFDRLKDTLKGGLLELLYQMTVKKWIFNIAASVTGGASGIAGAASALQGASNAGSLGGSLLSMIGTAGSAISAAGTLFGSTAVSAFGSGLTGAVIAGGGDAAMLAYATATANLSAGAAAGASVGGAASGFISGATSVLAAIPVWGWAALAGAAAIAYFGGSGPEDHTRLNFTSNNAPGNISINERGNEGRSDTYVAGAGATSSLGTFGVNSTFWMAAESPTVKSFLSTVALADDALAQFMSSTEKAAVSNYLTGKVSIAHTGAEGTDPNAGGQLDGVFRDRIINIFDGLEPGLASLISGFTGTSQALAVEAEALLQYRAALKNSGEAVFGAKVTLQEIAALKAPTESTSAALVRITGQFNTTNQVLGLLGKTSEQAFGATGLASAGAREQLIQLSGGVAAMGTQAAAFAQNYFTDAERLIPVSKAVAATMGSLGLQTIPTTRAEFRKLIDDLTSTGAIATETGAMQFTGLMSVAEAFAQVHPLIETTTAAVDSQSDILSERIGLQKQLDQLTMTSDQLRAKERATIAAANVDLFDEITLRQKSADVLNERTGLQKQLDQLTMTSTQLRAKERTTIAAANLDIFDQITRRQEVNATTESLKVMFDKIKTGRDSILAYRDSLQLGTLSTLTPIQRYLETQRQYTEALAKAKKNPEDSAAQSAAQTAATSFLTASQVINASSAAFVADRAHVMGDMTTLADIAGAQMTETQRQLALAGQQVTGIATLNTTALGIQEAITNLDASSGVAALSFDVQRYTAQANAGSEALVAEIKRLNARIDDLVTETKGRRADAERQNDEVVGATESTGVVVAEKVKEAATQVAWAAGNTTRQPAL